MFINLGYVWFPKNLREKHKGKKVKMKSMRERKAKENKNILKINKLFDIKIKYFKNI